MTKQNDLLRRQRNNKISANYIPPVAMAQNQIHIDLTKKNEEIKLTRAKKRKEAATKYFNNLTDNPLSSLLKIEELINKIEIAKTFITQYQDDISFDLGQFDKSKARYDELMSEHTQCLAGLSQKIFPIEKSHKKHIKIRQGIEILKDEFIEINLVYQKMENSFKYKLLKVNVPESKPLEKAVSSLAPASTPSIADNKEEKNSVTFAYYPQMFFSPTTTPLPVENNLTFVHGCLNKLETFSQFFQPKLTAESSPLEICLRHLQIDALLFVITQLMQRAAVADFTELHCVNKEMAASMSKALAHPNGLIDQYGSIDQLEKSRLQIIDFAKTFIKAYKEENENYTNIFLEQVLSHGKQLQDAPNESTIEKDSFIESMKFAFLTQTQKTSLLLYREKLQNILPEKMWESANAMLEITTAAPQYSGDFTVNDLLAPSPLAIIDDSAAATKFGMK